jgi:hypothetical protein
VTLLDRAEAAEVEAFEFTSAATPTRAITQTAVYHA